MNTGAVELKQPLTVTRPGSPGGLTPMGKVGRQELPIQLQAQQEARGHEVQALREQSAGQQRMADAAQAGLDEEKRLAKQLQHTQEYRSIAIDRLRAQLEADAQAEMGETINPHQFFEGDKGVAKSFLAVLGMGLGGLAAGNTFAPIMNRLIDQNLEAQKQGITSRAKGRNTRQTALQLDIDKYGSEEAGLWKRKADAWDLAAKQANIWQTTAASKETAERAAAIASTAVDEASKARMQAAAWMFQNTIQPTGPSTAMNPAAVAEYLAKGGDPKLLADNTERFKKMGLGSLAGPLALLAPQLSPEMRDELFKAGLKEQGGGDVNTQTHQLSQGMAQAGIPEAQSKIERLRAVLASAPRGEMPEGLGLGRRMVDKVPGLKQVAGLTQGDAATVNRNTVTELVDAYRLANTGVAFKPEELEAAVNQFLGENSSPAALQAKLDSMQRNLALKRSNVMGGASPAAQRAYEQRRQSALGGGAGGGIRFTPVK
jgi:hypothetical protein